MNPTPEQVRKARIAAGLTQKQAAELIYCTRAAWQHWEYGVRKMSRLEYEAFLEKTKK